MDARVQDPWRHDDADDRVRTRMLRHADAPTLEFVEAEPEGAVTGAPVLFIHGAFGGAWMWREIFLPYFCPPGPRIGGAEPAGAQGERGPGTAFRDTPSRLL
jgi:pimeloyl-ACP methyl ester carboxylesterase